MSDDLPTIHPLGLTKLEAIERAHKLTDRHAQSVVVIQPNDTSLPFGYSCSTFTTWEEAVRRGRRLVPVLLITRNHHELDIQEDSTVRTVHDLIQNAPSTTPIVPVETIPEGMRRCPDCKEIKPVDRFGPHGHNPRCYTCQAAIARSYITPESRAKIADATRTRFKAAARVKEAAERTEPAPPEPEPEPVIVIQKQQQPRIKTNELRRRIDEVAQAGGWELTRASGFWKIMADRADITASTVHAAYDGANVWSTTYFRLTHAIDKWLAELTPPEPPLQIDGLPVPGPGPQWQAVQKFLDDRGDPTFTLPTMPPDPDPEPPEISTNGTAPENRQTAGILDWRYEQLTFMVRRLEAAIPPTWGDGDADFSPGLHARIAGLVALIGDLIAKEQS